MNFTYFTNKIKVHDKLFQQQIFVLYWTFSASLHILPNCQILICCTNLIYHGPSWTTFWMCWQLLLFFSHWSSVLMGTLVIWWIKTPLWKIEINGLQQQNLTIWYWFLVSFITNMSGREAQQRVSEVGKSCDRVQSWFKPCANGFGSSCLPLALDSLEPPDLISHSIAIDPLSVLMEVPCQVDNLYKMKEHIYNTESKFWSTFSLHTFHLSHLIWSLVV